MFVVRHEKCKQCGCMFTISLEEFIHKVDNGMKLPKRCKECRKKNRKNPDLYEGLRSIMRIYPSTKGHRHTVHGGYPNIERSGDAL